MVTSGRDRNSVASGNVANRITTSAVNENKYETVSLTASVKTAFLCVLTVKLQKDAPNMPLDDLVDDEETDSSSAREYVQPSKEEFEECLSDTQGEWVIDKDAPTQEYVYDNHDILPEYTGIVLRCYSTIDKRTEMARSKGADAIRLFIFNRNEMKKMGGRVKTLRTQNWCKNLKKKVKSLFDETEEYVVQCEECENWMVIREGRYGEFLGCSNYPNCEHTEQIND